MLGNRQQIACMTYTNVAKDEIRNRTDHHPIIFADTIHAFCWGILQNHQFKLREHLPGLGEKWQRRIEGSIGICDQKVKYDLGYPAINDSEIALHHDDVVILMARMLAYSKFQKLLKCRFPILFIDEYQDTDKRLADSIVTNLVDNDSGIIVGLFGDHWQKIYGSSACGLISSDKGKIVEIGKKANFRSDRNIVHCLNRMRPELPQAESDTGSQGKIKVFHSNDWVGSRRDGKGGGHWKGDLPEINVKQHIERVKELMLRDGWDLSSTKTKILFLTNNLIASEQNFKNLADCFRYSDDYLKKSDKYIEYFLEVIEQTAFAYEQRLYGELLQNQRSHHPQLTCQSQKTEWANNLDRLLSVRANSKIGDMLDLLLETETPRLPGKIVDMERKYVLLASKPSIELEEVEVEFVDKLRKLREVAYSEVSNLGEYIDDKTPFSTKHGVKGAQFDNVLVICGRGWNQYNWNQMLEWMNGSCPDDKVDMFERNRNLFYVSCSRAKHNLTLLFTQELSPSSIGVLEHIVGKENVLGSPFED